MSDLRRIFAWPLAMAISTLVGLMTALWGGPAWHWLSWIGLAMPLGVIAFKLLAKPSRRLSAGRKP